MEGGGGSLPTGPAPLAKKIFRNSAMSEENWKTVEKMIEKIRQNCMGKALYDEMVKKLNGKTLIIAFDGNYQAQGVFNPSEGKITLGSTESNIMLHELFHAYQYYNELPSSISGSTLNREVEAWYAQYVYVSKLNEYKYGAPSLRSRYERTAIGRNIIAMEDYLTPQGTLKNSNDNDRFANLVISTADSFKKNPDYQGYKFDYDRWGIQNFTNLIKLSKGC